MSKLTIFEPAMCCETGLCGVGVDPELLRISTITNTLKKQGVEVERYNLSSAPNAFVQNIQIKEILNKEGIKVLPVTMVNDKIIKKSSYPTNDELMSLLGITLDSLEEGQNKGGDCGCSGGGCCC
nr:arsenite efflux transporter metallochaperone ArsD [uncultured Anaerosporobacter sp.]